MIPEEEYTKIKLKTLKLQGLFLSKIFNEEYIDNKENLTTIAKERGKKYSKIAKETGCAIKGAVKAAKTLKNMIIIDEKDNKINKIEYRNNKISKSTTKE